jgi:hypothetical protein
VALLAAPNRREHSTDADDLLLVGENGDPLYSLPWRRRFYAALRFAAP